MKLILILVALLNIVTLSYANCVGTNSVHNEFCSNTNRGECEMKAVCDWKEEAVKVEAILKNAKKKCIVKDAMQVHAHLCKGSNYMACKTHSGFCDWK